MQSIVSSIRKGCAMLISSVRNATKIYRDRPPHRINVILAKCLRQGLFHLDIASICKVQSLNKWRYVAMCVFTSCSYDQPVSKAVNKGRNTQGNRLIY